MSTLKVDTIQKADGTGSLSVPAESGTVVTTASPSLGRRNLIINGSMQVDQRYSGTAWTNWNGYSADRWHKRTSGSAECSIQTVTDAPDGFKNSYKSSITTGVSGTHLNVGTALEGQDIVSLAAGTSSAKNVTLSFWVKASIAGTYCVAFQNPTTIGSYDSTLSYISEYSISSVNTWEYKTITLSMATTGTWNASNGIGLVVRFSYGKDSTYSGTANSWVSGHKTNTTSQTDLAATTGATFQITGVQLEVGSVATPFEHRSYGEELALCKRYFEKMGGEVSVDIYLNSYAASSTDACIPIVYATKRASPTATVVGSWNLGNNGGINMQGLATTCCTFAVTASSTGTTYAHTTGTSTYLTFDAEL